MPRWAARKDANHNEVAAVFLAHGWSVLDLYRLGGGVPDLLIAKGGRCALVEVKVRGKRGGYSGTGARQSAEGQALWAEKWRGCPVYQSSSVEAAQAILGALAKEGSGK